jgi:hypothetical protein
MASKTSKNSAPDCAWSIYRLRSTPAEYLGRVIAPDQDGAIAKAIEEFKITNPAHQKRLIATRRDA